MIQIQEALTDNDIQNTWEAMQLLRPHLQEAGYVELVKNMMTEGYRLAFIQVDGKVVSVMGYRHLQFLFNGRHIYIDDLSTLEAYRGKGYGSMLLNYVANIAKEKGYRSVTLDSGTHRHNAHRLYMSNGFVIQGYHFTKQLE